jgi:hypothetical protein
MLSSDQIGSMLTRDEIISLAAGIDSLCAEIADLPAEIAADLAIADLTAEIHGEFMHGLVAVLTFDPPTCRSQRSPNPVLVVIRLILTYNNAEPTRVFKR